MVPQQTKNELITEISAVLSFSAINNNDKVGVILFLTELKNSFRPKKGKSHILRVSAICWKPNRMEQEQIFALLLEYFSNVVQTKHRFLFSDFMDNDYLRPAHCKKNTI